ncbi:MAG: carboxypeptidase regulatory-like domain-containing protein [Deltaproteobacteria bacterium]|nr:carboxypeptidase regulatory-like domain-containing protein [Deltaproteobacteria bacterium]
MVAAIAGCATKVDVSSPATQVSESEGRRGDGAPDSEESDSTDREDTDRGDGDGDGDYGDGDGECANTSVVIPPEVHAACPCNGGWKNHGKYVSCVAHKTNEMRKRGVITGAQKGAIQSAAECSSCGKACSVSRCNDNDACTNDACSDGACVHTPLPIDDGVECTVDSCDLATGVHHDPSPAGTACGIGNTNACQGIEACDGAGVCVELPPPESAPCPRTITTNDTSIPGAQLDLPAGAAPLSQSFTIASVATPAPGGYLSTNLGAITTVGHTVAYEAVGVRGDYYFDPSATCVRVTIPFEASLVDAAPESVRSSLSVYQVTSVSGTAATLVRVTGPIDIDVGASTVSFCTSHLSLFIVTVSGSCTESFVASPGQTVSRTYVTPITFDVPDRFEGTGLFAAQLSFLREGAAAPTTCTYFSFGSLNFMDCNASGSAVSTRQVSFTSIGGFGFGNTASFNITSVAQSCAQKGFDCGVVFDGCGGYLPPCGVCSAPGTCGGDGSPNVCGGVVPFPEDVAPVLSNADSTSFADGVRFIWEGSTPIQRGVAPGAIDLTRVSLLRGRVIRSSGAPFGGVKVTVAHHPELGETDTRGDGTYDIAFNGGGTVTLVFERPDHFPAERSLTTKWNAHTHVSRYVTSLAAPRSPTCTTARGCPPAPLGAAPT